MPRSKAAFDAMRESTKQKIDTTATALFAKKGLSVTVDEIAKAIGISKGLLYNHYKSKEELIIELAKSANMISSSNIKAFAMTKDTALNKIKQITMMMCGMLDSHHFGINSFIFMTQVGMSGFILPPEAGYSSEFPNPIESFAKIIKQGQNEKTVVDGDATQLSIAYWAAIQGLCFYYAVGMESAVTPRMLNRILLKEDFL